LTENLSGAKVGYMKMKEFNAGSRRGIAKCLSPLLS